MQLSRIYKNRLILRLQILSNLLNAKGRSFDFKKYWI